jgi:hypothetical protein
MEENMPKFSVTERRLAFLERMTLVGKPLEPAPGTIGHRGPLLAIYKITTTGQTVRLRTNDKPALISVGVGLDPETPDAPINVEGQDFVGVVIPASRRKSETKLHYYLVPTTEVVECMRAAYQHTGRRNKFRRILFDGDPNNPGEGFAQKWEQYRLPDDVVKPDQPPNIRLALRQRMDELEQFSAEWLAGLDNVLSQKESDALREVHDRVKDTTNKIAHELQIRKHKRSKPLQTAVEIAELKARIAELERLVQQTGDA